MAPANPPNKELPSSSPVAAHAGGVRRGRTTLRSVRESLEMLIRFEGWRAELFASAEDFLAYPRPRIPSCLVLDVGLPDLNGLDLQARIAVDRPDMPIIFITGRGDVPVTVKAMKGGAIEFLTKPYGDAVLLGAIRTALDRSQPVLGHDAEMQTLHDRHASPSAREREVFSWSSPAS